MSGPGTSGPPAVWSSSGRQAPPVPSSAAEAERRALTALTRLVEPPCPPLVRLVEAWGACEVLERIASDDPAAALPPDSSGGAGARERRERWRQRLGRVDVDRDLALAARSGARLVVPGDGEWPAELADLGDDRPLALWCRGAALDARPARVAVVGARAATPYGEHVAGTLAGGLAQAGRSVVSGGAFGIDAAAHRGALLAGGTTCAVLACGVDVSYPKGNEGLLRRVAEHGTLVSEYPLGTGVTRGRFLDRNRLLAALGQGTLLVEAGLRSGARSTVGHARRLHRPVMVVPGPVTSPASAGCHVELRRGDAVLVTCVEEVLDVVGQLGGDAVADPSDPHLRRTDALGPDELRVWEAMPLRGVLRVDELCGAAGLTAPEVLGRLGALAARGLVQPEGGGWRRT
ncbi:DNA processing protein [Motilibacter rhizosphaerae]|uniref:DNA processing protein n=1 Tax=Motilibacter rhizosphaerae TaxID=598652 RepID=A0A4Q7NP06_9ACTN|nr:DNA-processing protein DprA [Motilibacter rhizosphaerae]RZS86979.1 DNA processing protein [Motilibacter rhizosphaerae]